MTKPKAQVIGLRPLKAEVKVPDVSSAFPLLLRGEDNAFTEDEKKKLLREPTAITLRRYLNGARLIRVVDSFVGNEGLKPAEANQLKGVLKFQMQFLYNLLKSREADPEAIRAVETIESLTTKQGVH